MIDQSQKRCTKCYTDQPCTSFHKSPTHPSGLQSWCKTCTKLHNQTPTRKKYRKRYNQDHQQQSKQYRYQKRFHLSLDDVETIQVYQKRLCAICKRALAKPNTDHDHKTGLIRGALCWNCNKALGAFQDDPIRLLAAIFYLLDPPAVHALGAPRFGLPGRTGTKKQTKLAKKLAKNPIDQKFESQNPVEWLKNLLTKY